MTWFHCVCSQCCFSMWNRNRGCFPEAHKCCWSNLGMLWLFTHLIHPSILDEIDFYGPWRTNPDISGDQPDLNFLTSPQLKHPLDLPSGQIGGLDWTENTSASRFFSQNINFYPPFISQCNWFIVCCGLSCGLWLLSINDPLIFYLCCIAIRTFDQNKNMSLQSHFTFACSWLALPSQEACLIKIACCLFHPTILH